MLKEYKIYVIWDDGTTQTIREVVTANPKDVLFNETCKMLSSCNRFFDPNKPDNVRDWIKSRFHGTDPVREHHFVYSNGITLGIIQKQHQRIPHNTIRMRKSGDTGFMPVTGDDNGEICRLLDVQPWGYICLNSRHVDEMREVGINIAVE